jgi:small neutral amino acid transporter SnatA (MarC family)
LISRRAAFVLLAAAAWTLFIWVTRVSNIVGDDERSTGFKVVHVVLALVSVAFAIAIAWIGLRALRTRRT